MKKSKLEILEKYVGNGKKNKHPPSQNTASAFVRDVDEYEEESSEEEEERPERIESDEEEQVVESKHLSANEKLKRKFKEALGVEQDEELN